VNPSPRPFQIECNLGIVRAIAEMLMQSTGGEIKILPALPREWKSGSVQGLHAKGGFQVDIVWDNRSLKESRIRSSLNKRCIVRVTSPVVLSIASERNSKKLYSKDGLLEFNALKGKEYIITPIQ
jgi:alpha-L-fucosidase 2